MAEEEDEFAGLPEDEPLLEDDDDDDDDSDDDEDDDEEEGETAAAFLPVMKGTCTVTDSRLFWSGKWADSEAQFAAGSTKKFKYGGPDGLDDSALDAPPATGNWNGYFMTPGDEGDNKVREKGVVVKFVAGDGKKTYAVSGEGTNEFGDFTVTGSYDVKTRRLEMNKTYGGGGDDEDDDDNFDADANEDDDYGDELAGLNEDGEMPIEELMKRYKNEGGEEQEEPKKKKAKSG